MASDFEIEAMERDDAKRIEHERLSIQAEDERKRQAPIDELRALIDTAARGVAEAQTQVDQLRDRFDRLLAAAKEMPHSGDCAAPESDRCLRCRAESGEFDVPSVVIVPGAPS